MSTVIERLQALAVSVPWQDESPRVCCPDDPKCPWNGGFGGITDANGEEIISWSQAVDMESGTVAAIIGAVNALPDLLKLARATWALMDADRRILAYPPHRAAAIEKAASEVEAALEPLFREVPS